MRIREFVPADLERLKEIHSRQGFDYAFPNIFDPLFLSKLVMEDDGGHVMMASIARLTCEMYFLADPKAGSPRERYERMLALHRVGELDLAARGLDDAHAWLPPRVARRFGKRLEALGWLRDADWTPYCYRFKTNKA